MMRRRRRRRRMKERKERNCHHSNSYIEFYDLKTEWVWIAEGISFF
jgi:hypothetical protein